MYSSNLKYSEIDNRKKELFAVIKFWTILLSILLLLNYHQTVKRTKLRKQKEAEKTLALKLTPQGEILERQDEELAYYDCKNVAHDFNKHGCKMLRAKDRGLMRLYEKNPQFKNALIHCAELKDKIGEGICIEKFVESNQ